ncbi:hypothetical protein JCM10207_002796 [Rhodosporidiobolus poonsookiae]
MAALPARARSPVVSSGSSAGLSDLLDATAQHYGNPNSLPGPPRAHFFPSVSRAQRETARAARLASASPPPVAGSATASRANGADRSSSAELEDDQAFAERQRQAKVELAAAGPFDNRRPSAVSASPFPTVSRSVGTGGSGGTKRRHRDLDRTEWDAASELVRLEKEREKAQRGPFPSAPGGRAGAGKAVQHDGVEEDSQKTPTPSFSATFAGPKVSPPADDAAMAIDDAPLAGVETPLAEDDARRPSAAPSIHSVASIGADEEDEEEGDEAMAMDDESMRSGYSGTSKATGADTKDKEPAKKRSRTLTTPAQTAVLNALLAKTRFPSTETREEVGKQIGMSARRVQIWFQNRRQSQKRQRDRDAQDAAAAAAAGQHLPHPSGFTQPMFHHPYAQHVHIDPYSAANGHFYPPLQPKTHIAASPYGHPQPYGAPHPGASRPSLHQRPSMDSIASRASFISATQSQHSQMSSHPTLSTHGSERDGLGPLPSESRYANPYAPNGAYGMYGRPYGQPQPHQPPHASPSLAIPSKLYFPHVPRPQHHAPPGRVRVEPPAAAATLPTPSAASPTAEVKLPSLSAILSPTPSGAVAASAPHQSQPPAVHAPIPVPVSHQPMFSHSPFSPPPQHATLPTPAASIEQTSAAPAPGPSFGRALLSPEPSSSSFERLRISGGPFSPPPPAHIASPITPLSPSSSYAPSESATPATSVMSPGGGADRNSVDILDVAIETMAYRPSGRQMPARQMLPPLRSVLGDSALSQKLRNKGGRSEADKALLAPILPSSSSSAPAPGGPPRLAPISTFAPLTAPSPPNSSSATSPLSPPSHGQPLPPVPVPASVPGSANLRSSTWSDASHATRSTADFGFANPPAGSYRERDGSGWAGVSGYGRERGSSVAGSARTSVSSELGVGAGK